MAYEKKDSGIDWGTGLLAMLVIMFIVFFFQTMKREDERNNAKSDPTNCQLDNQNVGAAELFFWDGEGVLSGPNSVANAQIHENPVPVVVRKVSLVHSAEGRPLYRVVTLERANDPWERAEIYFDIKPKDSSYHRFDVHNLTYPNVDLEVPMEGDKCGLNYNFTTGTFTLERGKSAKALLPETTK